MPFKDSNLSEQRDGKERMWQDSGDVSGVG